MSNLQDREEQLLQTRKQKLAKLRGYKQQISAKRKVIKAADIPESDRKDLLDSLTLRERQVDKLTAKLESIFRLFTKKPVSAEEILKIERELEELDSHFNASIEVSLANRDTNADETGHSEGENDLFVTGSLDGFNPHGITKLNEILKTENQEHLYRNLILIRISAAGSVQSHEYRPESEHFEQPGGLSPPPQRIFHAISQYDQVDRYV
ncbi:hypothetical protein JR316_0008880 [Psilocybe cubensis]|uniref:Uncharacterized protein n=1 Tax=Psilocybe cubensis TaxID=181762 RepID=A0ACB8GSG6_PSICU|nr:hypothetical protein JR316_0008880 [Psilocybe cubensis]KAH9478425.1 hypothetical protein JR316_0008880 [Psilocybe cubensis]